MDKTEEKQLDLGGGKENFKYDEKYHKMADFLGVKQDDKMDSELAEKIAFIRDFTGETEELEAMIKIRDMKRRLGTSIQGKDLVKALYQLARLEGLKKDTTQKYQKEMEKLNKEADLLTNP